MVVESKEREKEGKVWREVVWRSGPPAVTKEHFCFSFHLPRINKSLQATRFIAITVKDDVEVLASKSKDWWASQTSVWDLLDNKLKWNGNGYQSVVYLSDVTIYTLPSIGWRKGLMQAKTQRYWMMILPQPRKERRSETLFPFFIYILLRRRRGMKKKARPVISPLVYFFFFFFSYR